MDFSEIEQKEQREELTIKNSNWLTNWVTPNYKVIHFIIPLHKTKIFMISQEFQRIGAKEITIPTLNSTLVESYGIKYAISPFIKQAQIISSYELVPGWEEILNILKQTIPDITKKDLTGFVYGSPNALTHLFVTNYTVEEIEQTSNTHDIFHIYCNCSEESIVIPLIEKYQKYDNPIGYPETFLNVN